MKRSIPRSASIGVLGATAIAIVLVVVQWAYWAPAESRERQAVRDVAKSFWRALSKGDSSSAIAALHPDVLIFENGVGETLQEYRHQHLGADIAFLGDVERTTRNMTIAIHGDVAVYLSEFTLVGKYDGRTVISPRLETLVLVRTTDGWRIRHIHWSD